MLVSDGLANRILSYVEHYKYHFAVGPLLVAAGGGDEGKCYESPIKYKDADGNDVKGDFGTTTIYAHMRAKKVITEVDYKNIPGKFLASYCGPKITQGDGMDDQHLWYKFADSADNTEGRGKMTEEDDVDPVKIDVGTSGYSEYKLSSGGKAYCEDFKPCPGPTSFMAKSEPYLSVLQRAGRTNYLRYV